MKTYSIPCLQKEDTETQEGQALCPYPKQWPRARFSGPGSVTLCSGPGPLSTCQGGAAPAARSSPPSHDLFPFLYLILSPVTWPPHLWPQDSGCGLCLLPRVSILRANTLHAPPLPTQVRPLGPSGTWFKWTRLPLGPELTGEDCECWMSQPYSVPVTLWLAETLTSATSWGAMPVVSWLVITDCGCPVSLISACLWVPLPRYLVPSNSPITCSRYNDSWFLITVNVVDILYENIIR